MQGSLVLSGIPDFRWRVWARFWPLRPPTLLGNAEPRRAAWATPRLEWFPVTLSLCLSLTLSIRAVASPSSLGFHGPGAVGKRRVARRLNFTATAEEMADTEEMWQSKDKLVSEWCQVGMPPADRNKGPTLAVETQKLDGEFWGADCLGSTIDLCTPPCSPFAGSGASDSEAQHGDKESARNLNRKFGCARLALATAGASLFCASQSSSAPCFLVRARSVP